MAILQRAVLDRSLCRLKPAVVRTEGVHITATIWLTSAKLRNNIHIIAAARSPSEFSAPKVKFLTFGGFPAARQEDAYLADSIELRSVGDAGTVPSFQTCARRAQY